jgi:hypothetical protein
VLQFQQQKVRLKNNNMSSTSSTSAAEATTAAAMAEYCDDYRKLLQAYRKVVKHNRDLETCLQISQGKNAALEEQLKSGNNNRFVIGGDPFPTYPDEETCVKNQMNSNGKSLDEATTLCSKLADDKTQQASTKGLPAWRANQEDLIYRGGDPNNIAIMNGGGR